MLLNNLEQQPLYNAVNFSLPITVPASQTVRTVSLSVFLCPSSTGGSGPVVAQGRGGRRARRPTSRPGQYVASAGQFEVEDSRRATTASSTATAGSASATSPTARARR